METLIGVLLVLVAAISILWWRRRGEDLESSNYEPGKPRNDGGNRIDYGGGAG